MLSKILKRQDELQINNPKLKQTFIQLLPKMIAVFKQSERLSKDFEEILSDDIFNNLVIKHVDKLPEVCERGSGVFINHFDGQPNEICVKSETNYGVLCHELIHYIKAYLESKYGIARCDDWINESMTEYITSTIIGGIMGYARAAFFAKDFISEFSDFTIDDFFYDNMNEYKSKNVLFCELKNVYEDFMNEKSTKRPVGYEYDIVMAHMLGSMINKCINNNVKLSDMLQEVSKKEGLNKFSNDYTSGDVLTNVYVRGIREFCEKNGYQIMSNKEQVENIKKLVSMYRQNRFLEIKHKDVCKCVYTINICGHDYYLVNLGEKGYAFGDKLSETIRGVCPTLIDDIIISQDGLSGSANYKNKIVSIKNPDKGISLQFDLKNNCIVDLKAPNPSDVVVSGYVPSEVVLKELKSTMNGCLVENETAKKMNRLLRNEDVKLKNTQECQKIIDELNLIADYLGSDIMVCNKESMWTVGNDAKGAAMIGLRGPAFMPDVALKIKKLDLVELDKVLETLDLSHLEESAIMLRTADGELIDVGNLSCVGEDKSGIGVSIKRHSVWKYLSDDIKQKIMDINKFSAQSQSGMYEML